MHKTRKSHAQIRFFVRKSTQCAGTKTDKSPGAKERDHFSKDWPDIALDCRLDLAENKLPGSIKLVLYRMVQEGIDNVVTHSMADRVFLRINNKDGLLTFKLDDNGVGFDVTPTMQNDFLDDSAGLGLQRMTERAESSGGRLEVFSKPGNGTRILAEWILDT